MRAAIKRMGNSAAILLPKPVLAHLGVSTGDILDLDLADGRVVITVVQHHPREGWAEAAKQLAVHEDDAPVWPDFDNEEHGAL